MKIEVSESEYDEIIRMRTKANMRKGFVRGMIHSIDYVSAVASASEDKNAATALQRVVENLTTMKNMALDARIDHVFIFADDIPETA